MIDPQSQPVDDALDSTSTTESEVTRRVFHRLSMAAFSGMVAGSMIGCNGDGEGDGAGDGGGGGYGTGGGTGTGTGDGDGSIASTTGGEDEPFSWLTAEKHVCRGLNACEGKGAGEDNACAGQGTCATVAAHACSGQNECRGQGGCGENPGENACKEQGGCEVPLSGAMWETARANFEAAMTEADKEFGEAPAAL